MKVSQTKGIIARSLHIVLFLISALFCNVLMAQNHYPIIHLFTLDSIYVIVYTPFSPPSATAYDSVDGDISSLIQITGDVNTSILGVYTLTYEVENSFGSSAKVTKYVHVHDPIAPEILSKESNVVRVQFGIFTFNVLDHIYFRDNYSDSLYLIGHYNVINSDLNLYERGVYASSIIVSDSMGNESKPFTLIIWVNDFVSVRENNLEQEISIYPNPSNGRVNLTLGTSDWQSMRYYITNSTGSIIKESKISIGPKHMEYLELIDQPGIYWIHVILNNSLYTRRLISINN